MSPNKIIGRRFYLILHEKLSRWRWSSLYMVLILAVCGVIGTSQLHLDTAFRPTITGESAADSFRGPALDAQRSNAFIGVIIKDDEAQTPYHHILRQTSLAVDSIDGVARVESVSDSAMVDWMYGTPVGKRVRGVVRAQDDTKPGFSIETSYNNGISDSRKDAFLLVSIDPDLTEKERLQTAAQVVDVVDRAIPIGYSVDLTEYKSPHPGAGTTVWEGVVQGAAPGLFIVLTFLWAGYRNPYAAFIPTVSVGLSLPIAIGTMKALGVTMSAAVYLVPGLVLLLGTIQAVSIINSFIHWCGESQSQEGSVRRAIVEAGPPCVLASAGILLAFVALALFASGLTASFGLMAAIAGLTVTLVTMVVVPTLLMVIPHEKFMQAPSLRRPFDPAKSHIVSSTAKGI